MCYVLGKLAKTSHSEFSDLQFEGRFKSLFWPHPWFVGSYVLDQGSKLGPWQ